MNLNAFFESELDEHLTVTSKTRATMSEPFAALVALTAGVVRAGGKIMLFGNGGSAADAHNIATEFAVRYKTDRAAIPAIGLTTDGGVLTAIGNDFGFEHVFARQIEALGKPGDLAIGISTSGRSPNVLEGLKTARSMDIRTAAFGGGTGGDMVELVDLALIVPSKTTARIQEMHILLGQMLCGAVEVELGLVPAP
ncbi:MAG: SIS domain-containing protein [Alphaproteobacteria bacterium]|nr:SIS domain-containing protein [Alphaproteobacteria bacterium]